MKSTQRRTPCDGADDLIAEAAIAHMRMEKPMTTAARVVPFEGKRMVHQSTRTPDEVLEVLRGRMGNVAVNRVIELAAAVSSVEQYEAEITALAGDSGFILFAEMDHGAWINLYGIKTRLVRVIFGNPLVAITMLRHDVSAGLFVPIELLVAENPDGGSVVTYVLPSSLIAIEGNADLLEAAMVLDAKAEALVASAVG